MSKFAYSSWTIGNRVPCTNHVAMLSNSENTNTLVTAKLDRSSNRWFSVTGASYSFGSLHALSTASKLASGTTFHFLTQGENVKRISIWLVAFVASCLAFNAQAQTTQPAAEKVDSNQYLAWSKYKPGTTVTQKLDMKSPQMSMSQEISQTLVEVTPDKATVEVKMTMNMGGQTQTHSNKVDLPAKVEKGHEDLPPEVKGTYKEAGKETVEVAGKSYECTIGNFEGESAQGKVTGKVWRSKDIPGGMAKMEMNMDAMQIKVTSNVTGFEAK